MDKICSEQKMNIKKEESNGIISHSKQLECLKENDPSFYEFLKSQNPELLNFDDEAYNENLNNINEDSDENILHDNEDSSPTIVENDVSKKNSIVHIELKKVDLTVDLLKKWVKGLKANRVKYFKNMVLALNDVVYEHFGGSLSEKTEQFTKRMTKTREGFKVKKDVKKTTLKKNQRKVYFSTKNYEVIKYVLAVNLKHIPLFLQTNLIEKQYKHPHLNPKWKTFKSYIFSYLSSVIQIISSPAQCLDVPLFITKISPSFIFYHTFCDLSKSLLKNLISLFTNELAAIRSVAIESIAEFLKLHPRFFPLVFKQSFELYCANYKQNIYKTDDILKSLTNNIITLVSANSVMSYQFIFENLRTNARLLRDAISLKNKKMAKDFYNWKMLGTFDLWFTVISNSRDIPNIKDLIFPLVEITLAVLRLSDTPAFYPSQLHYIRSILKIVTKDLYIPLIPNILKILVSTEITTLGTKCDEKSPIIRYMNHIPPSLYHSKLIKDALFDEASDVFLEYLCIVSQSITFPEFSFFVTRWLRKSNKSIKVVSISKQLKIMTDKIEETAENITKMRNLVDFSPKDSDKINLWENENLLLKNKNISFNTLAMHFKKSRTYRNNIIQKLIDSHISDNKTNILSSNE